jgi:hypothetical protein
MGLSVAIHCFGKLRQGWGSAPAVVRRMAKFLAMGCPSNFPSAAQGQPDSCIARHLLVRKPGLWLNAGNGMEQENVKPDAC